MNTILLEAPSALDHSMAMGWLAEIHRNYRRKRGVLEIDCSEVRNIDSVGVAALFELHRTHGLHSHELRLINAQAEVVHSLEIMGVHREFSYKGKTSPKSEVRDAPILIVEDESVVRSVASMALRPLGMPIIECENAIEGTRIAAGEKPCLIVLDYLLPVMDGAEMLRWLKDSHDTRGIPVMMMSSDELGRGALRDEFADASAIFRKPFSPRAFRDQAARLIDQRKSNPNSNE